MRVRFAGVLWAACLMAADPLTEKVTAWRTNYEAGLRGETGWLTVAGLFWLDEGANPAGSAPGTRIELPDGPARAGVFTRHGAAVTWQPAGGPAQRLKSDKEGTPDLVRIGRLTLFVIDRNGKIGLRLRDPESSMRRQFTGTHWFPIGAAYSVTGQLRRYPAPRQVKVPDVTGNSAVYESPGEVFFTLHGQEHSLEAVIDEGQLFFVFKDRTAGHETYGGGRMLYAPLPGPDGKVMLEFNIAKNPPCAFTPFATCPIPTRRNTLPVELRAGELVPPGH